MTGRIEEQYQRGGYEGQNDGMHDKHGERPSIQDARLKTDVKDN